MTEDALESLAHLGTSPMPQLGQALSQCRPPWLASGHPLHPEALPLTHAARDQQRPLRDVRLPAPQLPLPPPHPSSAADGNSRQEPGAALFPGRGPAPEKWVCVAPGEGGQSNSVWGGGLAQGLGI